MDYVQLGRSGLRASRLGFGCLRLPLRSPTQVDRDEAIPLLRRAVALGINYFDTAVGYCGGDSQRALGEAMQGIRDKVILSTKNPHYDKKDVAGWRRNLEDSLERLRTDRIDVYNFHGLNYETFVKAVAGDDGLYKQMLAAREEGLIHHICHSFHGTAESLKQCIDTGLFESVTLQYNLLDQRLAEGIAYAHENGMGVVVMGPVGGGRLGFPSQKALQLVGGVTSTPDLALRFVLSNEGVSLALSGMATLEQLEQNVQTVSETGRLTPEDHQRIEGAIEERKKLAGLYCTGCNYCMPCPDGVDIPANFEILNSQRVFGLDEYAKSRYAALGGKAALCRLCRKCVALCPQELDIPARLGEAATALDERNGSIAGWSELRGAKRHESLVTVQLRYHLKNFTASKQDDVRVSVRAHREEQVYPGRFVLREIEPFARKHRNLEVRVAAPLEALTLDSLIEHNESRTLEHLCHIVSLARPVDQSDAPYIAGAHVPGPLHPIHGSEQKLRHHSFDFAPSYDDQKLVVWVDVEDDLRCKVHRADSEGRRADCFRMFVDARKPHLLGRGGYDDGVMYVSVYPLADDPNDVRVSTSNDTKVGVEFVTTEIGYRFQCALPWSALGRDRAPRVIGFDLVLLSHDGQGQQTLRLAWSGRSGQERDTATFGRLLLI